MQLPPFRLMTCVVTFILPFHDHKIASEMFSTSYAMLDRCTSRYTAGGISHRVIIILSFEVVSK